MKAMQKRYLIKLLTVLILCVLFISCFALLVDDDENGPEFLGLSEEPIFGRGLTVPDPFGMGGFIFRRAEPWVAPMFAVFELERYEKSPPFYFSHFVQTI